MKKLTVENSELLKEADSSSLSSSATAGGSTISVYSITSFGVNDILLIGEFGAEGSEIIPVHSATAPTGTTITLSTTLVKSHPKDTKVYIIPYNQITIFHSTTETGAKTEITSISIDAEKSETVYEDKTYSSGYYFIRYYNSVSTANGDYSDPIPYAGLGSNTVGYIINFAMSELKKEFSDVLTFDTLLDEVNACLRYVRGKLKRWSNVQEFDYVVDQLNRGEYKFALPTTYYDKNSDRSCLGLRVGDKILDRIDWTEFKEKMEDVHHTTVSTAITSGDTSIVLDSTDDFDSSGTVHIYSSNTLYTITYTGNTKSTNTLTGCSGITADLASGLDVWQGESEGTPDYFTIADGYLYIWNLTNSTHQGENIYMDFYTDIVEVDSDADEITLARYDMVKHWVKWAIKNITERKGTPDFTDGDWVMFNTCLNDAIRRESSGQKFKRKIKINGIDYRMESNSNFDTE